ncbi:MAG: hypothetical protein ABIT83_00920, partial [Massilia sp.]
MSEPSNKPAIAPEGAVSSSTAAAPSTSRDGGRDGARPAGPISQQNIFRNSNTQKPLPMPKSKNTI